MSSDSSDSEYEEHLRAQILLDGESDYKCVEDFGSFESKDQIVSLELDLEDTSNIPSLQSCCSLSELELKNLTNQKIHCLKSVKNTLEVLRIKHGKLYGNLGIEVISSLKLTELHLDGCKLKAIPETFPSTLKLLSLSNVETKKFEDLLLKIADLASLERLNLSSCNLTSSSPSWPDLAKLVKLEILDLHKNRFEDGLPKNINQLKALKTLNLSGCLLKNLSDDLASLGSLTELNISHNSLEDFPTVICKLKCLSTLNISHNSQLRSISEELATLQLKNFVCEGCLSVNFPPHVVLKRGPSAVLMYLQDLFHEKGQIAKEAFVAIMGNLSETEVDAMIRKIFEGYRLEGNLLPCTSNGIRKITCHLPTSSSISFLNMGKLNMAGIAYCHAVTEFFLPLLMIDLDKYSELLSSEIGYEKATKRMCLDHFQQLYLICPNVPAPSFLLTSRNMSNDEVQSLKEPLKKHFDDFREQVLVCQRDEHYRFCQTINRFSPFFHDPRRPRNNDESLFQSRNVFVLNEEADIERFKNTIIKYCCGFNQILPKSWEIICQSIRAETPYTTMSKIRENFDKKRLAIVLQYLTDSGEILQFCINGETFIVNDMDAVSELVGLFFHQQGEDQMRSLASQNKDQVENFRNTGILNVDLFKHIVESKSKFPFLIAVELMQHFHLAFGPVQQEDPCFVFPYFCTNSVALPASFDENLHLRLDMSYHEVLMPPELAHLFIVTSLSFFKEKANECTFNFARNGAIIRCDKITTHVMFVNGVLEIRVLCSLKRIGKAWKHLGKFLEHVIEKISQLFPAAHAKFESFCSHCIYIRAKGLGKHKPYMWLQCKWLDSPKVSFTRVKFEGCIPGTAICEAWKSPCFQLTEEDIAQRKAQMDKWVRRDVEVLKTVPTFATSSEEWKHYVDFTRTDNVKIVMDLEPCTHESVIALYHTEQVYSMKSMKNGKRGRVLILDNTVYYQNNRAGAQHDYENLQNFFKKMNMEIARGDDEDDDTFGKDCNAEELKQAIKEEVEREDHEQYSMFWLVLTGHGGEKDTLALRDGSTIKLSTVMEMLSARNFPAMKGKPKVIIWQACAGNDLDLGDFKESDVSRDVSREGVSREEVEFDESPPHSLECLSNKSSSSASSHHSGDEAEESVKELETQLSTLTTASSSSSVVLDDEDFFILKPSQEGKKAFRFITHGSPMIRVLLPTFYKHACHIDVKTLFELVKTRVKDASKDVNNSRGNRVGGCIPEERCNPSKDRKFFLFPKFPSLDYRPRL